MVNLNKNTEEIKKFISSSIDKFQTKIDNPNSIGIYCCAWSGWITTNFNEKKRISDTENNCPDFDFVEFDFLEISEWASEYETENPEFQLNGSINAHNHVLGDENLNKLVFEFLKPIVTELKKKYNTDFLLQMLDSNMVEEI